MPVAGARFTVSWTHVLLGAIRSRPLPVTGLSPAPVTPGPGPICRMINLVHCTIAVQALVGPPFHYRTGMFKTTNCRANGQFRAFPKFDKLIIGGVIAVKADVAEYNRYLSSELLHCNTETKKPFRKYIYSQQTRPRPLPPKNSNCIVNSRIFYRAFSADFFTFLHFIRTDLISVWCTTRVKFLRHAFHFYSSRICFVISRSWL